MISPLAPALALVLILGSGTGLPAATGRGKPAPGPRPAAPAAAARQPGTGASSAATSPVARVATYNVSAPEFEATLRQFQGVYEKSAGRKLEPAERTVFERNVLEQMIRQRLLRAEAKRRGIGVPDAEAERVLRQAPPFQQAGGFDESTWAAFKANAAIYQGALADTKEVLASQRLFEKLRGELEPSDARLDAVLAERSQSAELRVLTADTTWFEPGVEMHSDSLRALYRAMEPRFATVARARVGIAVVPFPAGPGGASPAEAIRRQTQARAESLLAAVRAGASFDSVAGLLGGERDAGWWTSGQPDGAFGDDRELGEAALAAAPGQLLDRPLRALTGYALVRVSAREPARVAPLSQVADSVRREYRRTERRRQAREQVAAARATHADLFRTSCTVWHAALVDTSRMLPKPPSPSTLRAWYEEHGAEFGRLDAEGHGVVRPPLEEVQEAVRARFLQGERWRLAQGVADRILSAWGRGRRDTGAEKLAQVWYGLRTTDLDAPPAGVPPAVLDSTRGAPVGRTAVFPGSRGFAVYAVASRDSSCALPEPLAVERTREILDRELPAREEEAARAYFDAHGDRYRTDPTYHYTFLLIDTRPYDVVDIPRAVIERYYREHADEFGQPEEVHVRHLLVVAPPGADTAAALAKVTRLLAAVRAGAGFDSLARANSDDPNSRDQGGDMGWLRRGVAPSTFEPLAFSLGPGEVGGPVRTRFGYHLVQGIEKHEEKLTPLRLVHGLVGQKVSILWADSLARAFGDSLLRRGRGLATLQRYARERVYELGTGSWLPGTEPFGPSNIGQLQEDLRARTKPGMLPRVYPLGPSYFVAYLDSISPPGPATWELARDRATADARGARRMAQAARALEEVRGEVAAGVPWDSAAAPWGGGLGFAHRRGNPLPGIEDPAQVDSVLYGSPARRLAEGQATVLPGDRGATLVELIQRTSTVAQMSPEERQALRQAIAERSFYEYFEKLKSRFPVRILRPDLRIDLPAPPAL